MQHEMLPVISIYDLEAAVQLHYDLKLNLRQLLFGDDYTNDCYKMLSFDEDANEDWCYNYEQLNLVYGILRDSFPGYDRVLIDVSW